MRHHTRLGRAGLALITLVAGALTIVPPTDAQAAPGGFSVETMPFAGLIEPTAVEFASTGQVFVAERRGVIKVFDSLDDPTSTNSADLRLRVFNGGDRGLLGMALDPQYPARPYIWALYAKNADIGGQVPKYGSGLSDTDVCTDGGANDCRISSELTRLTLDPTTGVWTGVETVLLTGWCQQFGSHSVGSVVFGPDGFLYVSAGDGASYNGVDTGTLGNQRCDDSPAEGGALRAQSARRTAESPAVLNGAVLRVDPDTGAPAPGNPFIANADPIRQRILAYGMRNPFRIAPRPSTSEIWVADVGWGDWEEINKITIDSNAENFGWPCYEGSARQPGYDSADQPLCETLYSAGASAVVDPVFQYNHGAAVGSSCAPGSSSISGLAFTSGSVSYPAAYQNGLFFADYARGCVWYAQLQGSAVVTDSVTTFATDTYASELVNGPNGDIYIVDIVTEQIKRIRYTAGGNTPPIAKARANPTSGSVPLTVNFDGSGSSDPDAGGSVSYAWDLDGDGAFDDSAAISPTWTYSSPGTVLAKLRVTDNLGASSEVSVTIYPGNTAPAVTLSSPAATTPWQVGDNITFSATANDAEDGVLPAERVSTKLVIKHCPGGVNCHSHVQQTFPGFGGSFVAPDHEYPSWLDLELTATDSAGVVSTTSLRLDPATVNLHVDTVPSGLSAVVGAVSRTTPFDVSVIQGSTNSISVTTPQVTDANYEFRSWSDGGSRAHDVVAAQSANYVATFENTGPPPSIAGLVGSWSFNEGSGTVAADGSGNGNTGSLVNGAAWTSAGKYGGAITFDGVNDYVSVPDSNSLDVTSGVTLAAWVRPTTLGAWRQIVLKERPGDLVYALYATGETGNRPEGQVVVNSNWQFVQAPAALAVNTWSHVAMTYDGAAMRVYVNGSLVATKAQTGAVLTSGGALRIGGNSIWGEWFAGQIDEVRVYNRALSGAEVVTDSTTGGVADTQPPSVPAGLAATASLNSVSLSWAASTDNASPVTYEIHRSQVNGFSPVAATKIASGVSNLYYTDTPLPAGTYYYRVIASDGPNMSSPSAQASAVVAGDTQPPSVPAGLAAVVSGSTVNVSWSASTDNVGVVSYQVQRVAPGGASTTFLVNSPGTTLADVVGTGGTYSYSVRAGDQAGNWSAFSSGVSATVLSDSSPPSVTLTAPSAGATVAGSVLLRANATDDVGVVGVQFSVDGVAVGAEDTVSPYEFSWSSTSVSNGAHQITALARDASGKSSNSAPVSVTVANSGPSGLVGSWSFNEGSGTVAADGSGNGNTGSLVNGAAWTSAGKYGGAITFDGVNDYVSVPDSNSLDVTSGVTLAAWVRPTTLGAWRQIVLKERPGDLVYALYATGETGNRPEGQVVVNSNWQFVQAPAALAVNTWSHVAMTYDGAAMRVYVNGSLVATKAQTGAVLTSGGALRIGGNSIWGEWFAGQIDEVRVYNRALSGAEVVTARDTAL